MDDLITLALNSVRKSIFSIGINTFFNINVVPNNVLLDMIVISIYEFEKHIPSLFITHDNVFSTLLDINYYSVGKFQKHN